MKIGTLKETFEGEQRVALTPESALQLKKLGHECIIEKGAGLASGFNDAEYKSAGVTIAPSAAAPKIARLLVWPVLPKGIRSICQNSDFLFLSWSQWLFDEAGPI